MKTVMLTEQGHIKVMDFGLAKRLREPGTSDNEATTHGTLTGTGSFIGTPAYMAPEQILGGAADERSDVFSFGVVLYELLGGCHPFRKETTSDTLAAIVRDPPTPPRDTTTPTTYAIFDRLLAKEPGDRYANFVDIDTEVRRLLESTATSSVIDSPAVLSSSGRRTPYVGREAEQAELNQLVDEAIRGRGGLMLIGGEPGVGKTRLVEQVLAYAHDRRCLALTGRCYEMEGTPPFVPFVEMVEQCTRNMSTDALKSALGDAAPEVARLVPGRQFPDMSPPLALPPDQQQRYLFKNVTEFLERASRTQCLVFLLDDLTWADTSTSLLLQHLAPQLEHMPMLILGTYRDVELTDERPFARTLETLTRERVAQRTTLQRLEETDVGAMLAALGGPSPPPALVDAIYRETQGNPFFVEEVFQHLSDERTLRDAEGRWLANLDVADLRVPEGVRLVIGRRLERVGDDTRRVLTAAAIVGRSFGLELLEAIGGVTGDGLLDALEEAERAFLIMPSSNAEVRWEFTHALIRQTLAESLSLPRRQRLHLRVAEAIEKAGSPAAQASDIAHHLHQAGGAADPEKAVRYLMLAGDLALEAGAFDEAIPQFEHALSRRDANDRRVTADLRYKKGRALRSVGRWAESADEWKQALSIYMQEGDHATFATVCWELAHLLMWVEGGKEAVDVARAGLDVLGSEPTADRSRLLAICGMAYAISAERPDELIVGEEMISEALTMAEAVGDPRAHREALFSNAYLHFYCMRSPKQAELASRAADMLRATGDLWHMAEMLAIVQLDFVWGGRLEGAARFGDEAEPLAQRLGHMGTEFYTVWGRGMRDWLVAADLDRLEASCQRGVEVCGRANIPWGFTLATLLAMTSLWRGRWVEARDRAQSAVSQEPPGFAVGAGRSILFVCECRLGHTDAALALLEDWRAGLPRMGRPNTLGAWILLLGVIEGLVVLRERQAAAELYPLTLEAIETGTVVSWIGHRLMQTVAGIAAAAGEQWEQSETHYQTALTQAHEIPFRSEQPEVRRWYAQMLVDRNAAGDRDKARTMLMEAVETYDQIGMPRHVGMAKDTLKDL